MNLHNSNARQEVETIKTPRLKLCDFRRIHLARGKSANVSLQLPTEVLAYYEVPAHRFVIVPAKVEAFVGSSSAGLQQAGSFGIVQ